MPNAKCQRPKAKCRRPNAEGQRSKGRRSKVEGRRWKAEGRRSKGRRSKVEGRRGEARMLNVHRGTCVRRAGSAYFSGQFRESPANLRGTRRAICMTMEKPYDIRERSFLFSCEVVD